MVTPPFHPHMLSTVIHGILQQHEGRDEFIEDLFMIAGSYPAAVWAWPNSLPLKYHDVDVYVFSAPQKGTNARKLHPPDDYTNARRGSDSDERSYVSNGSWGPDIVDQWKELHNVGRRRMELNIIILGRIISLDRLLSSFDVNCVKAGFEVHPGKEQIGQMILLSGDYDCYYSGDPSYYDDGDKNSMPYDNCTPALFNAFLALRTGPTKVTLSWKVQREFKDFLGNPTLKLVNPADLWAGSACIIRLIFKAQDLKLPLEMPTMDELEEMNYDKRLSASAIQKYESLLPPFRAFLDSLFNVKVTIYQDENEDLYSQAFRLGLRERPGDQDENRMGIGPLGYHFPTYRFWTTRVPVDSDDESIRSISSLPRGPGEWINMIQDDDGSPMGRWM
jgi:hypothetical protein